MTNDKIDELLVSLTASVNKIGSDIEWIKKEVSDLSSTMNKNNTDVKALLDERTNYAKVRQDSIKAELSGRIGSLDARLKIVEQAPTKAVMTRWEQIKDYLFKIGLVAIVAIICTYLGLKLPK